MFEKKPNYNRLLTARVRRFVLSFVVVFHNNSIYLLSIGSMPKFERLWGIVSAKEISVCIYFMLFKMQKCWGWGRSCDSSLSLQFLRLDLQKASSAKVEFDLNGLKWLKLCARQFHKFVSRIQALENVNKLWATWYDSPTATVAELENEMNEPGSFVFHALFFYRD